MGEDIKLMVEGAKNALGTILNMRFVRSSTEFQA